MGKLSKLGACVAVAAILPTGSKAAPKAECLWQGLPAATRDKVIVAYKRGGQDAAAAIPIAPDLDTVVVCAGGYPSNVEEAKKLGTQIGSLAASVSIEKASAARLAELGYGEGRLDGAWSGLGAEKRAILRSVGDDLKNVKASDELIDVVVDAAVAAGMPLTNDDIEASIPTFSDYFLARAIRENWEAR